MGQPTKARSGRPTPAQLEARKARVLEIATKLFIERGYAATPVSEIARLSRVSPRLITAHFGDKPEIFTAIIMQANERAFSAANEIEPNEKLEEVLLRAARFAWKTCYSPNAISFLRMAVGEGERMADQTSAIAERSSDHFFEEIETFFIYLLGKGMIESGDPKRLAKYFVDLMVGFSLVQAGMGYWDRVPDDAELRDKIMFFCRATRKQN